MRGSASDSALAAREIRCVLRSRALTAIYVCVYIYVSVYMYTCIYIGLSRGLNKRAKGLDGIPIARYTLVAPRFADTARSQMHARGI